MLHVVLRRYITYMYACCIPYGHHIHWYSKLYQLVPCFFYITGTERT